MIFRLLRQYGTAAASKLARPVVKPIRSIPWSQSVGIWWRSLRASNLEKLQNELVELMVPSKHAENQQVTIENKKVPLDDKGNCINEVCFSIGANKNGPIQEVAVIHGYGASLGCFARNFQLINKFSHHTRPVRIHFLDNLSFGLSSNPRIASPLISHWKIPHIPAIKFNDPEPTDPKKLYNKYYKLIESYEVDHDEVREYQDKFWPILHELESYYLGGIELWRAASKIEKLDVLVGHSYGGYWSGSYAVRYPHRVDQLVLLSPVGVDRHANAVTKPLDDSRGRQIHKPSLDPTSYNFLSRLPILKEGTVRKWYYLQPFLPRLLKYMGPWGVQKYYDMWYMRLFKINKLIEKNGGPEKVFASPNDLVYGTNKEIHKIIEYLYNSTSRGSNSDIYVKNLLTPGTNSKYPLYDKITEYFAGSPQGPRKIHVLYGQYDFMNSEAGQKLVDAINASKGSEAHFYLVSEGGHNLYIDNPFEVNEIIRQIVMGKKSDKREKV